MLSGTRMAKSAGNFFRVTELEERGIDPLAFRYLALQAKYRAPLNFSLEGLTGADRALRQLREKVVAWSTTPGEVDADWDARFRAAIADDLDFPRAMALVADLTRSELDPGAKRATLIAWDRVLGLDIDRAPGEHALPAGAQELIAQREQARAAKDFVRADQLRDQLAQIGVQVADKPLEK